MKKRINISYYIKLIFLTIFIVMAFISLFYTPYNPDAMDNSLQFAPMSFKHWMGCDDFGRDIFSRMMIAVRNTLVIAILINVIGAGCGIIIGSLSGYLGGKLDTILMRINDALFAFPSILLALLFVGITGGGTIYVVLSLGIAFIPSYVRISRGEVMKQKNMDYVSLAKLLGAGSFRIAFIHILPNIKGVLVASIMIGFNNAILAEAGLSFLGLGVPPPNASLGKMLSEAQAYLFTTPSYAMGVGVVMIVMILSFSIKTKEI